MNTFLAFCLLLPASASLAAAPLENASAVAAQLGASVAAPDSSAIAVPDAQTAGEYLSLAGAFGSISIDAQAKGNGPLRCSGGRWNGWIALSAQVAVAADDGASAQFPVTGTVYLTGSCQHGTGFANGSAMMSGSSALYKDGRQVGTVSLSGRALINQYVNLSYAWISQSVSLSGRYDDQKPMPARQAQ